MTELNHSFNPYFNDLLLMHIRCAGYPLPSESIIHTFVGGSQLHGAKVTGYDDLDIYGCYIEAPSSILGLESIEHFVWSSGSQKEKNTANDVDITMYSLHRWGELMLKGNPAILHYLFAPNSALYSDTWNKFIAPIASDLVTKKSAKQYIGFANSQRMRLTGERGMGRHGQRPDLVEKYGFDTKFAMHYIRLLTECIEMLRTRKLTFPNPNKELLIDIRNGKYTQTQVFDIGAEQMEICTNLLEKADLPEEVNKTMLSLKIADAYRYHWKEVCGYLSF